MLHIPRELEDFGLGLAPLHDIASQLIAGTLLHLLKHQPVTHRARYDDYARDPERDQQQCLTGEARWTK